jgi:hypothetical protein
MSAAPLDRGLLRRGVNHALCVLAFIVRGAFILIAVAMFVAVVGAGLGSGYVMVTNYGWIPLLVTMALIAGGFAVLAAILIVLMTFVEWAMDHSCRL